MTLIRKKKTKPEPKKVWTVIGIMYEGLPAYALKNKETGEVMGHFDCERWASYQAELMNKEGIG